MAFNHKSGDVTDARADLNLSVYDVTEAVNATKAAQKAIDEAKRLYDAAAADSKKASDAAIAEVNKAKIEAQNGQMPLKRKPTTLSVKPTRLLLRRQQPSRKPQTQKLKLQQRNSEHLMPRQKQPKLKLMLS